MVGVLHVDAQLLHRQHRLAPHIRARVERRQVEVAALVEHLRRARVAEQEVLELRAHVERVEAHRPGRARSRAAARGAGRPRRAVRSGVTTSQNMRPTPCSSGRHGSTANVLGSGIAIMSDSSIALKPVIEEPSKPMPASNASSSSADVDRERLQLPEDVREPEADEADLALLHERLDVLRGLRPIRCHPAGPYRWPPPPAIDVWPNMPAPRTRPRADRRRARGYEDQAGQGRRERSVLGTRATEDAAPRRSRASVAGDGGYETSHLFRFLALVEQGGHLAEAARAAFGDRAQNERLAARRRSRCLRRRGRRGWARCVRRRGRRRACGRRRTSGRTVRGPSAAGRSGARRPRRCPPCGRCWTRSPTRARRGRR